jgi:hypothetical protein
MKRNPLRMNKPGNNNNLSEADRTMPHLEMGDILGGHSIVICVRTTPNLDKTIGTQWGNPYPALEGARGVSLRFID